MAGLGSLYLLFEQSFTPISLLESRHSATQSADGIPRALLGLQVGLVVLAMIVTRSSVASLQAKSGLPIGNQVVGWAVLGQCWARCIVLALIVHSHFPFLAILERPPTEQ